MDSYVTNMLKVSNEKFAFIFCCEKKNIFIYWRPNNWSIEDCFKVHNFILDMQEIKDEP